MIANTEIRQLSDKDLQERIDPERDAWPSSVSITRLLGLNPPRRCLKRSVTSPVC